MRHRSRRHQVSGLVGGFLLSLIPLSGAAQIQQPATSSVAPFWNALSLKSFDVWHRLRDNFQWQDVKQRPRVQAWVQYFRDNPHNVAAIAEQARPWLHWIITEIEARELPGEIALLPFIESAYDPTASHPGGATGMWQFMPGTGDALGLRRDWWYDARMDVVASTRAALDYLTLQAEQWYDGDQALALAAYNAGAGTVNKAMRAALARGEPADYWHLRLPAETMNYVPKLLALTKVVTDPERYGVTLPAIPNQPVFTQVEIAHQLELSQIAELSGIATRELTALNPAFLQGSTLPQSSSAVLIPSDAHDTLVDALERIDENTPTARWAQYQVQPGDTLSRIAMHHSVPVEVLRQQNRLQGDIIRAGQRLRVPLPGGQEEAVGSWVVQVQSGDSLSGLAAKHGVSVADITRWNKLKSGQYLQPGQRLTLYRAD